jgi:hypothetical protein
MISFTLETRIAKVIHFDQPPFLLLVFYHICEDFPPTQNILLATWNHEKMMPKYLFIIDKSGQT